MLNPTSCWLFFLYLLQFSKQFKCMDTNLEQSLISHLPACCCYPWFWVLETYHITWDYRHLIHFWGLFHTRHGPTCHAVSARSTCVQLWRELVISSTAEREAAKHLEDSWFGLRPVECYHNFLSDQLLCMFFCWWNLWPKIESMRLADCCQLKHVLLLGAERIPKIPFDSDC